MVGARATGRIGGQFAWASGGRIVAAVLQAVLLVLVARAVIPGEFGLLASVLGVATVVQTTLDMGVSTFVTRERAADPDSGAVATALRFNALTSLLMAVGIALTLSALILADFRFAYLLPLAVWMSAERTADVRLTIAFADGDVHVNMVNLLARRAVAILFYCATVAFGGEPLLAFSTALALAAVGSSVFAHVYVRRHVRTAPSITFRQLMALSWPYWLHSVATQARNLDSLITALVAGAAQAGYFSVASRLTSPLRILPTTLSSVLLPHASRNARAGGGDARTLARLAFIAVLLSILLYGAILASIPWVLPLLLGAQYDQAVPAVMVVVAGLPFAAAISLYSSLLQGVGKKHFVATVSTVSVVCCLVGVAILGWTSGAIGAAIALSSTYALQASAISVGFNRLSQGEQKT